MFAHIRRFVLAAIMVPQHSVAGFYAVRHGRATGIVRSWAECEQLVKGFPGARYKKFSSEAEANRFVSGSDASVSTSNTVVASSSVKKPPKNPKRKLSQTVNKTDGSNGESGETDPSKRVRSALAQAEQTTQSSSNEERPIVYTDGACSGNGTANARAGIGVYWGDGDSRNVSDHLEGRPTNNRAEIHAAITALRQARAQGFQKIEIRTDSNFLVKAITKWVPGWRNKGWKLASGKPVINREDFEEVLKAQEGIEVTWTHVAGHAGIHGNEMADRLAVAGMDKSREDSGSPQS